jgi:hypothetical protein
VLSNSAAIDAHRGKARWLFFIFRFGSAAGDDIAAVDSFAISTQKGNYVVNSAPTIRLPRSGRSAPAAQVKSGPF